MAIEPEIVEYIDKTVSEARAGFRADMETHGEKMLSEFRTESAKDRVVLLQRFEDGSARHREKTMDEFHAESAKERDVLLERFKISSAHETGALLEAFRDEIKIIAELVSSKPSREEVREIVHEEVQDFIRPIEAKTLIFQEEMRLLRMEYNQHDKRIARLEARPA